MKQVTSSQVSSLVIIEDIDDVGYYLSYYFLVLYVVTFQNAIEFSVLIILVNALLLYLDKIISIHKIKKIFIDYYIEGLLFSMMLLIFPGTLAFVLRD